jgi:predicted O-methyltransferase YrrM
VNSAPFDRKSARRTVRLVIEKLVREGTVVSRRDHTTHALAPRAIPARLGQALRDLVVSERAASTIEIGLGYGVSTLFLCEGLLLSESSDPRHVAIDPFQASGFSDCGLQSLEEAGCREMVQHYGEESQIVLPRLVAEGRIFDLAFVDGNHRFDRVFLDLIYLGRLVRPGGIVFVDDYQYPAIAWATAFCLTNLGWKLETMAEADDRHQWAVLRTSALPDDRAFDYFVPFGPADSSPAHDHRGTAMAPGTTDPDGE